MGDDAPSPSPSPSPSSSSGASPSPSSPRAKRHRIHRYALGFEFAPRLAPYEVPPPRLPDWTEGSTFALLDAWGDRFVRAGRRGIRADDWLEVARLAASAANRPAGYYSESQCRNRIDTLRKKFRREKERARLAARRSHPSTSKWVYYDKMMSLICPPPPPPLQPPVVTRRRDTHPSPRLTWGTRAPEYMLGGGGDAGPGNSGSDVELGEPQKIGAVAGHSIRFAVLTKSIQKLGEVFERMESRKRQHMAEVEQMRRDFQRDLDGKWREILEKVKTGTACLGYEDVDEGDAGEDGDGGDDNKRLEDGGGEEQNNGAMDASP
ncbi:trihelix transcription factor ENAP1-like [Phragmites australis]|uniref:trihelix transcription factor ENAP1-like n=1 Tax=Phragmites australis TaxID=29695 RepID=UPI002D76E282|nr:trihelix transcription factor ENAP1-like [Phragmites australis]XP_062219802.1 trihelix transcription factor ENAP1-like [Phragmites australis]